MQPLANGWLASNRPAERQHLCQVKRMPYEPLPVCLWQTPFVFAHSGAYDIGQSNGPAQQQGLPNNSWEKKDVRCRTG